MCLLPFAEVVPWVQLSYSLRWEQVGSLVERLARLDGAKIAHMQQAVRLAWRDHLRPGAATRYLVLVAVKTVGLGDGSLQPCEFTSPSS